jgi:DNA replication protein DnaC
MQGVLDRTEVERQPFFPPLPPGWSLVREMECICDYDFFDTGLPERSAGCGGLYYRRICISPSGMVHNERTKCRCLEDYEYIARRDEAEQKLQKQREWLRYSIRSAFSGINLLTDKAHAHMKLEKYIPDHPIQKKALDYCLKYQPSAKGICLWGGPGRGKTHLAVGLARKLYGQGYTCLAIKSVDLLNRIKKSYNQESIDESDIIKILKQVEVLIIDDIGIEQKTDWAIVKLYEVIDYRTNRYSTILTTNLSEENVPDEYKPMLSRIYGIGEPVEVHGADRRVQTDMWSDLGTEVDV